MRRSYPRRVVVQLFRELGSRNSLALAVVLLLVEGLVASLFSSWPRLRDEATLATLTSIGAVVYVGAVIALSDRNGWRPFAGAHVQFREIFVGPVPFNPPLHARWRVRANPPYDRRSSRALRVLPAPGAA
jgi:hypothetical protein